MARITQKKQTTTNTTLGADKKDQCKKGNEDHCRKDNWEQSRKRQQRPLLVKTTRITRETITAHEIPQCAPYLYRPRRDMKITNFLKLLIKRNTCPCPDSEICYSSGLFL